MLKEGKAKVRLGPYIDENAKIGSYIVQYAKIRCG